LPTEGLRVLDLTRVIAGPVAGRALALWGADVLRVDPPQLPELPWQHVDMNPGKRVALLDMRSADGAARLRELAHSADVVLSGYRPDALHRYGLGAEDLLTDAGHLVVVELSAWGHRGPWRARRGFDSIVQAASGIATDCALDGVPGALPAQVLDHASGYLAAQTAMLALSRRPAEGGCHLRLSLARTGRWLRSFGPRDRDAHDPGFDPTPYVVETEGPAGHVRTAGSPFTLGGRRLDYPFPARAYGGDDASWS
jgi:crotonobetainyl-CoA:carnitine CoA-transferase CaiB-like acyl-CoA transferase